MKAEGAEYAGRKVEYRKKMMIRNIVPSSEVILDLGCGNGAYFKLLKERARQIVGVDISKYLCRCAKTQDKDSQIVIAVSCHLPFKDGAFDGVWASEVLEHSSLAAFGEVNRVSRRWFLATMPNPYGPNYWSDPSHSLHYSVSSLRCYFRSWTDWNVSLRGIGIEFPSCNFKVPRLVKLVSVALTWMFPTLAPTFCIWGKRLL